MLALLLACAGSTSRSATSRRARSCSPACCSSSAITIVQARRTDRAVAALRDLSSPRALVVRGGVERRIAGAEVVRGDLVRLHEGDRVPADGVVIAATSLAADESLLTGESMPVAKAGRRPRVRRLPGRPRPRPRRDLRDRPAQRARQDRRLARRPRAGAAADPAARSPASSAPRRRRRRVLPRRVLISASAAAPGSRPCSPASRSPCRCSPRSCPSSSPCSSRSAPGGCRGARARPPRPRAREPRRRHRAVRRQDRHADPQPHGPGRAAGRRLRLVDRPIRRAAPRPSTSSPATPRWRAGARPSTRWTTRASASPREHLPGPSTSAAGRWSASTR
jgi:hypothetical protein